MNDSYFDRLYGASDDPYALRSRWYEARKRALLLAALPERHYGRVFEPGCGVGELTALLADRTDQLLASDGSERAVAIATQRCSDLPQVRIVRQALPDDWPHEDGPFDLIVLSELGYFLDAAGMARLAGCCARSLATGGTLVACDWRPDFDARVLPTDAVHATLEALGLPRLLRHVEDDFLLQLWSRDARSVAERDGIR